MGGTRTGFGVLLEGVSCVCGRTSSFPAGERNQRLPGAGEDSVRAPPAPGPPSDKRLVSVEPRRGAPNGVPSGSALTAPLKTFRFQRGPVLREGKAMRRRTCFACGSLSAWSAYKKASPERGGARDAGGGVRSPTPQRSPAALSAAATTTPKQENAPTLHGREPSKEESSLFPATLRERGSGGEALLLEKRPLPQNLPTVNLFGREREGGGFSSEKSPPSHMLFTPQFLFS